MHVPPKKRNTSPLRTERLQHRWSQRELAERVGATVATVKRWERQTTVPGPYFRAKLMALFGKNEEELGLGAAHALPESPGASEACFTALTLPWNVPYQRNPFFTGRKKELDTLHQCLNADRAIALTQPYALQGLGGIGKTQLAVEYAYSHAREYTAILWISAETEENIITSFLHIAELLHLPESQRTNQQEVVIGVQRWLTSQSRWLLIWDNLEEMELLYWYLPPVHQGAILVTTRCQALGTLVQGIELLPMAQEEGVLFLLRRAKILSQQATSNQVQQFARHRSAEYAMAEEIVRIMDGLPLALDQAGAYVEETACSLTGYFSLYRERCKDLLDRRGKPGVDHPQSTTATLLLAYKSVERASAAAAELLCLCAFLHPDAIPEELLVMGAACLGSTLQAVISDPYQLDQVIALLRTYSFVNRFSETQTLTMHRLIQTVLKDQMDEATTRQWVERTVQMLNAAFPSGKDVKNWPQCQRYLPHVEICSLFIEQWKLTCPEAGQLLHRAGIYARIRAQYAQAVRWLAQARVLHLQARGTEHLEFADILHELAILLGNQGKYEEAEPLYVHALTIREEQLGPEHPETARTLNKLAELYRGWGKYQEAEPLLLRALRIWEDQLGEGLASLYIADTLNNLGLVYWSWGKYQEAEPLLLRALHMLEAQLGTEHPHFAMGLTGLARLYADQRNYEEATLLFLRALTLGEQRSGPEHPTVAETLTGLARLYTDRGNYEEAEPLYQRALSVGERSLGAGSLQLAHPLNGLGKLYFEQGKYEQAESFYQRALRIREQIVGEQHPDTAETLYDFAMLREVQGNLQEAASLYQRALAIREHVLGAQHPRMQEMRTAYAAFLLRIVPTSVDF